MWRHYVGIIAAGSGHCSMGVADIASDVSSRPMVCRHSVSRARGSTVLATAACSSKGAGTVLSHRPEGDAIQALMQLALPQLGVLGNRSALRFGGQPYPGWFRPGPAHDRSQVLQPQELSPVDWFFRQTVSMGLPEDGPDGSSSTPLVFRIRPRQSGCGPTSRGYQSPVLPRW